MDESALSWGIVVFVFAAMIFIAATVAFAVYYIIYKAAKYSTLKWEERDYESIRKFVKKSTSNAEEISTIKKSSGKS